MRVAVDSDGLTRPSFSTARREPDLSGSHLRQTLNPGVPVLPTTKPLSMLLGSGLCVAREPRLPRIRLSISAAAGRHSRPQRSISTLK